MSLIHNRFKTNAIIGFMMILNIILCGLIFFHYRTNNLPADIESFGCLLSILLLSIMLLIVPGIISGLIPDTLGGLTALTLRKFTQVKSKIVSR